MRYQRPARHAGLRVIGSIGTSENSEPGAVFDDVTSEPLEAALLLYIYRFLMRRRGEYGRRLDAIVHPYDRKLSHSRFSSFFFTETINSASQISSPVVFRFHDLVHSVMKAMHTVEIR